MLNQGKGSALLTALFIMTLVAIAATAMSTRLQLDIYRTHLTITNDKMYLASQSVIFWGMDKLNNKKLVFPGKPNAKLLSLPKELISDYPEFVIKGELYDLQAKFNLNNIQDKKYQTFLNQLIKNARVPINANQANKINTALLHWVSPIQLEKGKDPFEEYYLAQKPPYIASNLPMQSLSEFRLIAGVAPAVFYALEPYITVLPEVTPLNINSASKAAIMSLGNGVKENMANEIIQAKGDKAIESIQDILPLLKMADVPLEQITIESQYFLVLAEIITKEDTALMNYTVLKRVKDKKNKVTVTMVSESLNTL